MFMDFGKKGPKQTILSIFLFAVLAAITISILSIHSRFKPTPLPAFLKNLTATSIDNSTQPDLIFSTPQHFETAGALKTYESDTLFEKINGKAPFYLNSGFKKLITQRFTEKLASKHWYELYLYDMTTTTNAYSVFSTQRRPDTTLTDTLLTFRHYTTENGLYLQRGQYYVESIASTTSKNLQEAMIKTIHTLLTQNSIQTEDITDLKLFPRQGLNPLSLKLYLANTFGSEALTNTFVGQYMVDNLPITAYLSNQKSVEQAAQVSTDYLQFLMDSGGSPLAGSDSTIKYIDLFGTIESVFHVGVYVGGIHEGEDLINAQIISERLYKGLQSQAGP